MCSCPLGCKGAETRGVRSRDSLWRRAGGCGRRKRKRLPSHSTSRPGPSQRPPGAAVPRACSCCPHSHLPANVLPLETTAFYPSSGPEVSSIRILKCRIAGPTGPPRSKYALTEMPRGGGGGVQVQVDQVYVNIQEALGSLLASAASSLDSCPFYDLLPTADPPSMSEYQTP